MDKRPSCEGRPFGFQRLEAGRCSRESESTHRLHYRFRIMTGIHDAAGGDTTALLRASPPMTIWADGQSIQDSSVSAGSLLTHRATASEMSESRSRPAAARRTWRRTPRTVAVLLMNGRHVTRDMKRATADQAEGLRLDEDPRTGVQDTIPWTGSSRLDVHVRGCGQAVKHAG